MKLKYNFLISEVAGQTVAVPIDTEGGEQSIIKTNETGAYILELLKTDKTYDQILSDIKENFEVENEEKLEIWVSSFIEKLKAVEVLEYEQ